MIWNPFRKASRTGRPGKAALRPGLRIYAIGDIHGCATLLEQLHLKLIDDLARGSPPDVLWIYLGDYVDRGPDSKGVLDQLTGPAPADVERVFLKGNHEDMLLRFVNDPENESEWCHFGGFETLLSYRMDVNALMKQGGYNALAAEFTGCLSEKHARFLTELKTGYSSGGYYFCHAGIRPGTPIDRQDPYSLMWIRHEFLSSTADHGQIIVHGHAATEEPEVHHNRINIDTGAYATGRLTALAIEEDNRRFISVGPA